MPLAPLRSQLEGTRRRAGCSPRRACRPSCSKLTTVAAVSRRRNRLESSARRRSRRPRWRPSSCLRPRCRASPAARPSAPRQGPRRSARRNARRTRLTTTPLRLARGPSPRPRRCPRRSPSWRRPRSGPSLHEQLHAGRAPNQPQGPRAAIHCTADARRTSEASTRGPEDTNFSRVQGREVVVSCL